MSQEKKRTKEFNISIISLNTAKDIYIIIHVTIQLSQGHSLVEKANDGKTYGTWGGWDVKEWHLSGLLRRQTIVIIFLYNKDFYKGKCKHTIPQTSLNLKARLWLFWLQIFCCTITYCLGYYLLSDHSHQFLPQPHPVSPSRFPYKTLNMHHLDPNIIISFKSLVLGIAMPYSYWFCLLLFFFFFFLAGGTSSSSEISSNLLLLRVEPKTWYSPFASHKNGCP